LLYLKGALPFAAYLEMRGVYDQAAILYNTMNSFAQQAGNYGLRAQVLLGRGRLAARVERYKHAETDLEGALAIASEIGDRNTAAEARAALGGVLNNLGETEAAAEMLEGAALDTGAIPPEVRIDL
jgi:tetratricopeptide (TPR) repeat protein